MTIEVRKVHRTGVLIGTPVRNREGEDLGTIEEVMIDVENGHVAYLVLSFGGFLGMGDKLFAIPWDRVALKFGERGKFFLIPIERDRLRTAPGFDKDNWPDMSDPQWIAQTEDHFRDGHADRAEVREPSAAAGDREG